MLLAASPRVERVGEVPRHTALCRRVCHVGRRCAQSMPTAQVVPIDLDVFSAYNAVSIDNLECGVRVFGTLGFPRQAYASVPRQDATMAARRAAHALHHDAAAGMAVDGA